MLDHSCSLVEQLASPPPGGERRWAAALRWEPGALSSPRPAVDVAAWIMEPSIRTPLERPASLAARVAKSLREELRHAYVVGGQLPSEPELAAQYGVSRGTVRQALAVLEREGVIIRRQGAGTYVHYISRAQTRAEHAYEYTDLLRSAGFTPSIRLDAFADLPLTVEQAVGLDLEPGAPVLQVCKTFLANGRPAIHCIDRIPRHLILSPFDPAELQQPIFEFMRRRCHQVTVQNLAELIPTVATPDIAALLELSPGAPLLQIEEIGYNEQGQAVTLHSTYYHDQFVRFSLLRKRIE